MLKIEPWKLVLILLACGLAVFYALPNVFVGTKFLPSGTINLGLDLRGGSYLLLEVGMDEAQRDHTASLVQSLKADFRKEKIRTQTIRLNPDGFAVTLTDAADKDAALKAVHSAVDSEFDVTAEGETQITARYSQAGLKQFRDRTIGQSIEIVRRRVDESGTKEPSITRQGDARIVVQLPGVNDPAEIKNLLGKTAKLGFHMVDEDASVKQQASANAIMLPMKETAPGKTPSKLAVARRPDITGDMLTDAQPNFSSTDGQAVVSFRLNALGAKKFCDVSTENVNKPFAIVLDNEILSAPSIREPICGGQGQISGNFTSKEATDLAVLLRAGALPAPLTVAEERTIGPSLGADSVAAGKKALMYALVFVGVYVLLAYGLFGVFAVIGLVINCIGIAALLSTLGATLTLPGIAGIVLTIGMAVDANVIIFERIREEYHKNGKSLIASLDQGYKGATGTIIDANVTTLIAAILLFALGTGPVKGFAVTLTIGTVTSVFAAVMFTRVLVVFWLRHFNPKKLPI